MAITTGVLAGAGGLVHGVGEVRQGNTASRSFWFESWTEGRIADNLGGEPAVSVIPNLLLTGLFTIAVSLALVLWSARFLDRRHSGWVLVALSGLLLLVGGGIGPPLLGMFAGLATVGGYRVGTLERVPGRRARALAPSFPALFWVSVAGAVFLVLGSLAAGVMLDVDVSAMFVYTFFLIMVVMPLAILAGMAYESGRVAWGVRGAGAVGEGTR